MEFGKCKAVMSMEVKGQKEDPSGLEWNQETNSDRPEGTLRAS